MSSNKKQSFYALLMMGLMWAIALLMIGLMSAIAL
jgi:hypothetical protein